MDCNEYFIGVDVGTSSVRAALCSKDGQIISVEIIPVKIFNPQPYFYEQKSNEIWEAVCQSVQAVVRKIDKEFVKGIGFDATCSLVVLNKNYMPVKVNQNKDDANIIMWMDHRAKNETEFINSKHHKVLNYVGGKMSVEMQMPKLLWLKRNLPNSWKCAEHFLDLPDFLTFKATGSLSRSLCSLVCKWGYVHDQNYRGWDDQFLDEIELCDLKENNYCKIGSTVLKPGEFVGKLSPQAALELGLCEETCVAASIIDAHAGGLGLIFSGLGDNNNLQEHICNRLALICGTSTCHMSLSPDPLYVEGVWGPYLDALVGHLWLNEGGQSATGSLIDHIISGHPVVSEKPEKVDVYDWLEDILCELTKKELVSDLSLLTADIHVYPDFHGNRSPLSDSSMKGMICGLTLDASVESLALLYLATLQALAYGTKDIINQLTLTGKSISTVLMCGGLSQSRYFAQINSDVLGLPVLLPKSKESVLLGAAILGASASGLLSGDLASVAKAMGGKAVEIYPRSELKLFHAKKFEVFKKMQKDQLHYKTIMGSLR